MKFCDEKIQNHLLDGGKIKRNDDKLCVNLRSIKLINNELCFADGGNENYNLDRGDLTVDDWEIVEPEYNWDKIIKDKILCQFWDGIKKTDDPCVGYLSKKAAEGFYRKGWNCSWLHCEPFNPADFNIAKDEKELKK